MSSVQRIPPGGIDLRDGQGGRVDAAGLPLILGKVKVTH
jgi:hypothetical protein